MIIILLILLFVIYNTKVIENTSLLTLEQTKILKAVLPITIILGHISFRTLIQLYRILDIMEIMLLVCSFL